MANRTGFELELAILLSVLTKRGKGMENDFTKYLSGNMGCERIILLRIANQL